MSRHSITSTIIMKNFERITLATAAAAASAACAGILIRQAIRTRAERIFRVAAGESPYERSHPRRHEAKPA